MTKVVRLSALSAFLVFFSPVFFPSVDAEEPAEEGPWSGRVGLSYVNTSGNTDTETFASRLGLEREGKIHNFLFRGDALFAESDGEKTSDKIYFEGGWERFLSKKVFTLLSGGFSRDKFSGYEYRLFSGPGVGVEFVKNEKRELRGFFSLVYYRDKFSIGGRDTDDYFTGKLATSYSWNISENLKLGENLSYLASVERSGRYFIDSETALEVKINRFLSLGVGYLIDYQNDPPSTDLKKTDTMFLTNLILDF